MLDSFALDLRKIGLTGAPPATTPSVLREGMELECSSVIGVPLLDEALGLWCSWRRKLGHTPEWSDFRPFEHPHLLPHIMLYEQIGERFRCAIVGDVAGTALPVKLAGRFLDEAMPPENLADISRRLTQALHSEAPNFVEKTMAWQLGYEYRTYCALQMPFPGRNGKSSRVLSVMGFR